MYFFFDSSIHAHIAICSRFFLFFVWWDRILDPCSCTKFINSHHCVSAISTLKGYFTTFVIFLLVWWDSSFWVYLVLTRIVLGLMGQIWHIFLRDIHGALNIIIITVFLDINFTFCYFAHGPILGWCSGTESTFVNYIFRYALESLILG